MENTVVIEPTAEEAKQVEAALARMFAEVERIDERIAKDQEETARLRAETRQILAQLKAR
jgi:hypothetical protein